MADILERIAQPGDPDLDIDVDGATVTAVVAVDRHIVVHLRGGFGSMVNSDTGELATMPPGHPTAGVETATLHLWLPDAPDRLFDTYVSTLERWRDTAVPVRICGAPGRMFTAIEDRSSWLAIPRRGLPRDG